MLKQLIKLKSLQSFCEKNNVAFRSLLSINKRCIQTHLDEDKNNAEPNVGEEPLRKHRNPFAVDRKDDRKKELLGLEEESFSDNNILKNQRNPFAADRGEDTKSDPIQSLSPEEKEKRLQVLKLEADIAHQEGRRVPELSKIKDEQWEYILTLPSKSARSKYYTYLWQIQMKREAKSRKKEEKAIETLIKKEELRKQREENDHIIYGLGHCSFFLRIYDSTIDSWNNYKLIRAMQFAPKIVLDCSYDNHMNRKEAVNCAKQLTLCFADNRSHDDPFDMHYCNVNLDSVCMKTLQKAIPTMLNPEFPMNIHEKCFTEIFPKENIVYLTPHCRNDLVSYNHDDVYVIGAMVDTVNNEPLSLAKAKRLGLRMARLPLDRHLQWGSGSGKSLTLNQMINILLDLRKTGDWEQALQHVPKRKLADIEEEKQRERKTLQKRAKSMNIRIHDILNLTGSERNSVTTFKTPQHVRTKRQNMEFNLETWASKKRDKQ